MSSGSLPVLEPRQLLGIALAVLLVAATVAWKASGSPTPQLGAEATAIEAPAPPPEPVEEERPAVVVMAEGLLKGQMTPADLPKRASLERAHGGAVLCLPEGCAALRPDYARIVYTSGPAKRQKALRVLREGGR